MPQVTLDTKAVLIDRLYRICEDAPNPLPQYSDRDAELLNSAFNAILDLIEPYASQR
jgi:hypothetical protein